MRRGEQCVKGAALGAQPPSLAAKLPAAQPQLEDPVAQPLVGGPNWSTRSNKSKKRRLSAAVKLDALGKSILRATALFEQFGWQGMVERLRNERDLVPTVHPDRHKAIPYLQRLGKRGAPAVMKTKPWSQRKLRRMLKRGSHKSCHEHLEFLREEMAEFVEKGFWTVLPYRCVKHLKNLRLSPLGVVPQRDRRPRIIVDLTFHGVNQDTVQLAPLESMQFGRTLERIIYRLRHANPRFGPTYLAKIDLSDGFYRIRVSTDTIPSLAVVLPHLPGEEPLVAFPLSLPMGWVESPPYFSAATETVADLANTLPKGSPQLPHRLEKLVETPPEHDVDLPPVAATSSALPGPTDALPLDPLWVFDTPVDHHDMCVDDFCSAVQGNVHRRRNHQRRLLHSIDAIFRPLQSHDPPSRKDPASHKKLKQGDAYCATRKIILGWTLDAVLSVIALPPHRHTRLLEIFQELRGKRRISIRQWQKVLGELRSMVLAIPGGRGLFSLLQTGFTFSEKNRIRLTRPILDQLADFEHLARDLGSRPTRLSEIVPDYPAALGPVDAAGSGMGGVWLPATTHSRLQPLVWRDRFPSSVQKALVSFSNPTGTITNSDLELAGTIAHQDVLVHEVDCRERTTATLGDNVPSLSWHRRGSTTTTGPAAYLLRLNSLHQRHYRCHGRFDYLPGSANVMADDCSRLWNLTDSAFLQHFQSMCPQPLPWKLCRLRPAMRSSLICALHKQRSEPQSFLDEPKLPLVIGISGRTIAQRLASRPGSMISTIPSRSYKSSLSGYGLENSPPAVTLSDLARWRTTCVPSARRSPGWGPTTHV